MPVALDHIIVTSHDRDAAAGFLAETLGLDVGPEAGPFLPVRVDNGVTLDFLQSDGEIVPQHYAFSVSDEYFDAILTRILSQGTTYYSDPRHTWSGETYHDRGSRGLYFADPSGHRMEILTHPSNGDVPPQLRRNDPMPANDASPAEVLARFHEAEGQFFASEGAVMPSFEGLLHAEFVLVEPGSGPYGGEWRGEQGLRRFLQAMAADWAEQRPVEPPEVFENDTTAVAMATVQARSRATGETVVFPMCQVARVRDGLLAETRVFYWDARSMNQALPDRSTHAISTPGSTTAGDPAHPTART